MMGAGLGVDMSGVRLSAATQIAKTFLTVQSNYSDRILLLNLKDNLLSDISCKILSGLVEKTKSLRMLDLRGNMISPVGAKMLFDATRRNQSVLYVTQRQHGFMVEGHREIMGSVQERDAKNSHDERKLQDDNDLDIDNDPEFSGQQSAKKKVRDMKKRQPLRIDMRNNNPEQEAIEKLLESNEYTSRTGVREKYHNDLAGRDVQARPKSSSGTGRIGDQQSTQKTRPTSAANSRMAGAGMARSYGNNDSQALSRNSNSTRNNSNNMFQSSERRTDKPRAQLLPQVGDSDDSDNEAAVVPGERVPPEPSQMSEIDRRLAAKENERIIGIRTRDGGAGVGSLLDKEIRGLQEQHGHGPDNHDTADSQRKVVSKRTMSKSSSRRSNGGDGGSRRPQSAGAVPRSSRTRPASASGMRKSQSAKRVNNLNKSSSDGSVLKKKSSQGNSRTPQKGMSSTLSSATKNSANNNNTNSAYFHLNPAVLF
mmetsp:Transcript_15378/g.28948  ORF Transcript_15378/g.28948 Transcript_15378/m.28948 type:complete len:481 (-) Transcript_15378:138-1580(-)